jgi:hypothetical protein
LSESRQSESNTVYLIRQLNYRREGSWVKELQIYIVGGGGILPAVNIPALGQGKARAFFLVTWVNL